MGESGVVKTTPSVEDVPTYGGEYGGSQGGVREGRTKRREWYYLVHITPGMVEMESWSLPSAAWIRPKLT